MKNLQRHTTFIPGFDKRHSNPNKNYGIDGGRFIFVVSSPEGAVHFVMSPGLYPRSAIVHLINHHQNSAHSMHRYPWAIGFDVGYHSLTSQYDGQEISEKACEWLGGKPCYSDGSALQANEWMEKFLEQGTEWLWPALEQRHSEEFGQPKEE